ncbi:MAG TPA: carboxymuconolactone decarboxylase family protein [candidate division Zixibacteria bacterium]|nr:carboxymuconolactone decarboxylase family protein [candidate division Zixibacteria bacterium]
MTAAKGTIDCAGLIERAGDDKVALAVFSAAIAAADNSLIKESLRALLRRGAAVEQLYEIILQSYLFCGFPRMLEALFNFAELVDPAEYISEAAPEPLAYSAAESARFESDGRALIQRVYGANYERLERAVREMSPEIFRWMALEGYGKTLSRPGLDIVARELSIVAALTVDGRARQLRAHLRGALNVGAGKAQISETLDVTAPLAGEKHSDLARRLFSELCER